ncbi:S-layer family protein [Leptothoe sp. PORK10 BA2]|uniref:S-layer family protein n=1 Tax=Leptothoe sp. PORK10 BA2 TaxID=3110254 RepID=UPI002B21398B|nr:S-layer family protein [Leptothoe sp. PORK10 BA2]MEA5465378.1 S-layer family protein [Leptothoe sp. PORK10 BA2]
MSNSKFVWPMGWLGIISVWALALPSYGQNVVADDSVGTLVSGSGPFTITGGSQQLTTLFHSFQDFSPNTADVLFQLDGSQNAVEIVIGRVTGANASVIDGQLALTGGNNPDLFLINPHGITFGTNANLLLPGSFFASTAESVLFNDGLSFSSRAPGVAPLLSVSTPVGLQFGAVAQPITVNEGALVVNAGESLGFLGGDLKFTGSFLNAPAGELTLGSVAPGSQVGLDPNTFLLDYTNTTFFQDITLDQGTYANVSGDGGGRFQVQGRNVRLLGNAVLEASNLGPTDGGIVTVRASEQLEVTGTNRFLPDTSAIFVDVYGEGLGNHLVIEVDQLLLSQAALITTDTFAQGANGGMTINASEVLLLGNPDGNGAATVLASSTFDRGQGGNIEITAERLMVQGTARLTNDALGVGPDAGNGGDLRLNVGALVLRDGAQIGTGPLTGAGGDSGDLVVVATDFVLITGFNTFIEGAFSSGLFSSAEPGSTGNAGNLSITTPRLSVVQGGKVAVNTVGEGNGGSITIRAEEIEVADPIVDFGGAISGLVANAVTGSTGKGGSLDIAANRLTVYNGGQITASTDGVGNAGTVTIRADEIDVSGQSSDGLFNSGIMSSSRTSADAGSVNLIGNQITIRDGASVSVNSLNGGAAGNLTISTGRLSLDNGTLQAKVTGGSEGDLNLTATDFIVLRQNSQIITSATGMATGGNMTLTAPIVIGLENSDIVANAEFGSGGNIQITTEGLFGLVFREQLTPNNDITASSEFGLSGTVAINNFNVQTDSGLVELPTNLADASNQVAQECTGGSNRFIATGRGGVPMDPTEIMSRDRTWTDIRDLTPFLNNSHTEVSGHPADRVLTEAYGWYTNEHGQVELVAQDAAAVSSVATATCAVSARSLN